MYLNYQFYIGCGCAHHPKEFENLKYTQTQLIGWLSSIFDLNIKFWIWLKFQKSNCMCHDESRSIPHKLIPLGKVSIVTWLRPKSYSHFPPNILTLLLSKSDLLWPRRTVNVKDAVRIITGKGRRHGEYAATCYFLLLLSYQKQCHSCPIKAQHQLYL